MPYAKPGLHVTLMTLTEAAKHLRLAYGIPDGVEHWKPYQVIVQSEGCLPYTAFYTFKEFRRWLKRSTCKLRLTRGWRGCRYGRII